MAFHLKEVSLDHGALGPETAGCSSEAFLNTAGTFTFLEAEQSKKEYHFHVILQAGKICVGAFPTPSPPAFLVGT